MGGNYVSQKFKISIKNSYSKPIELVKRIGLGSNFADVLTSLSNFTASFPKTELGPAEGVYVDIDLEFSKGFGLISGTGRGNQTWLSIEFSEKGKSSPTEILETLAKYNVEGRPIWKPMHMQPIYRMNPFITREGNGRSKTNAYINGGYYGKDGQPLDIGNDIFNRGVCLPSDNKMTKKQQDIIIEIIKKCFE